MLGSIELDCKYDSIAAVGIASAMTASRIAAGGNLNAAKCPPMRLVQPDFGRLRSERLSSSER
jgi:hypothetical protein